MTMNMESAEIEIEEILLVWKQSLIAIGTVLAIGGGIMLAQEIIPHPIRGRDGFLYYLGWPLYFILVWGGIGIGGTFVYTKAYGDENIWGVPSLDELQNRYVASMLLALVTMAALGTLNAFVGVFEQDILTFVLTFGGPAPVGTLESLSGLVVGTAFGVLMVALLFGPAVAAVTHGVLQRSLADVFGTAPAIYSTATSVAVVVAFGFSAGIPVGFESVATFIVGFLFVLTTAMAFADTERLAVPIIGYGLLAGISFVLRVLPTAIWYMTEVPK
ncbi:hypothetical protein BRC85_03445 [Halobacteriales archaeon QS_1_69_70]|nr:MAG: hypothetical protein BRC85_03445 [Halobacteriales archaeon QS_1_69_70]